MNPWADYRMSSSTTPRTQNLWVANRRPQIEPITRVVRACMPAKLDYSRLNINWMILLFGRPLPFFARLCNIWWHFAADRKQLVTSCSAGFDDRISPIRVTHFVIVALTRFRIRTFAFYTHICTIYSHFTFSKKKTADGALLRRLWVEF